MPPENANTAGPWLLVVSIGLAVIYLAQLPRAIDDWHISQIPISDVERHNFGILRAEGTVVVVTTRVRALCLKMDAPRKTVCPSAPAYGAAAFSFAGQRAWGYYKADSNRLLSLQLDNGHELVSAPAAQANLRGPLKAILILITIAAVGIGAGVRIITKSKIRGIEK